MKIFTTAFENNEKIPCKFTCDAENISPEIFIEDVPTQTRSLVLIMDDPDSPSGNWSHWIVWNIDPTIKIIKENSLPKGAVSGLNDFGKNGYRGPCPSKGEHRYFFKLFALNNILNIAGTSQKADLEKAMQGSILEKCELVGWYSRV